MKTVADVLREARELKGKSLQEISDEIKIRSSYLHSLEENDYTKFLSEAQLKGFLVNYASYLNIETNKILALYRRERIAKEERHSPKFLKDKNAFVFTPRMLIGPAVAFLVLVVIGFFVYQYYQTAKAPELEINQPKDGLVTDNPKIVVSGIAEVGSTIRVNSKQITPLDNNGKFETTVSLEKGSSKIFVEVENGFKKTTTKSINVIYAPIEILPTPIPVQNKITVNIKSISAKALPFTVSIDGAKDSAQTINPSSQMNFAAVDTITIKGLSGSDVNIVVNGVNLSISKTIKSFTLEWDNSTNSIKQL